MLQRQAGKISRSYLPQIFTMFTSQCVYRHSARRMTSHRSPDKQRWPMHNLPNYGSFFSSFVVELKFLGGEASPESLNVVSIKSMLAILLQIFPLSLCLATRAKFQVLFFISDNNVVWWCILYMVSQPHINPVQLLFTNCEIIWGRIIWFLSTH